MKTLSEGEKGVRSAHTQSKVKALGDDLPGEHNLTRDTLVGFL